MRNQGTQPVYIYIEDSSDDVTFKLERADNISANEVYDTPISRLVGDQETLVEESENAVKIGIGQEVAIHMKVDTTGDSTPDSLLDGDITIQAKADPPADSPFGDS
jgi:hypothetical protein